MAERWRLAGGDAQALVYPESVHAFNAFPLEISRLANENHWRFVEKAVSS
jgi:hypothetical protein